MERAAQREGIKAGQSRLVEQLRPPSANDDLDDVGCDAGQGDRRENEEECRSQPSRQSGKAMAGKPVSSTEEQQKTECSGRNERPLAVADFRQGTEKQERLRFDGLHQVVNDTIQMTEEKMTQEEEKAPDRISDQRQIFGKPTTHRYPVFIGARPRRWKSLPPIPIRAINTGQKLWEGYASATVQG